MATDRKQLIEQQAEITDQIQKRLLNETDNDRVRESAHSLAVVIDKYATLSNPTFYPDE